MENILIPLAALMMPVFIVAIVFAYKAQQRRLIHAERLAMIEKGLAPQDLQELNEIKIASPARTLYSGVTTACIGVALLLGLGTIGYGPWLLGGLIPLAIGLGVIISYVATTGEKNRTQKQ